MLIIQVTLGGCLLSLSQFLPVENYCFDLLLCLRTLFQYTPTNEILPFYVAPKLKVLF